MTMTDEEKLRFKQGMKAALEEMKKEKLLTIEVSTLHEEPVIYYKGQRMTIDNFSGIDFSFKYEEDGSPGVHAINIAVDDDFGNSTVISHRV